MLDLEEESDSSISETNCSVRIPDFRTRIGQVNMVSRICLNGNRECGELVEYLGRARS